MVLANPIGVGVLSMPAAIAKKVGSDGIWLVPLAGVAVAVGIYLITKLAVRFSDMHFVQYIPRILGSKRAPWVGIVLAVPIIAMIVGMWLFGVAMVSRIFGEVMVNAVLQHTPIQVIILTLVASGAVVAAQRSEVIARFNEILLPWVLVPFVLFLVAWVQRGEMENLFPLFQTGPNQWLQGLTSSVFAFAGYEVILNYMPDYQQPKKAMMLHLIAITGVTIMYWTTFMGSLSVFGPFELVRMNWPALELVKVTQIPGMILERLESAIISIWMVAVFSGLVVHLNSVINTTLTAFRWPDRYRKWIALGCVPVLYVIAIWPPDVQSVSRIQNWVGVGLFGMATVVPAFLLIIASLRKIKGGSENASSS